MNSKAQAVKKQLTLTKEALKPTSNMYDGMLEMYTLLSMFLNLIVDAIEESPTVPVKKTVKKTAVKTAKCQKKCVKPVSKAQERRTTHNKAQSKKK